MKNTSLILLAVLIVLVALAFTVLLGYGAYWLALKAGAPKYVAVIVGIFVWVLCGISANLKGK